LVIDQKARSLARFFELVLSRCGCAVAVSIRTSNRVKHSIK